MAAYTIHLAKVGKVRVNQAGVERDLRAWFGRVIRAVKRGTPNYSSIAFNWISGQEEIKVPPREILVYLMNSRSQTLLPKLGSNHRPDASLAGVTVTENKLTLSEVYCDCRSARSIAETIFHEAMHNKTGWGNHRLHKTGGIAGESATSISGAEIAEDKRDYYNQRFSREQPTPSEMRRLLCRGIVTEKHGPAILTSSNVKDMARVLRTRRPQWGMGMVPTEAVSLDFDPENL